MLFGAVLAAEVLRTAMGVGRIMFQLRTFLCLPFGPPSFDRASEAGYLCWLQALYVFVTPSIFDGASLACGDFGTALFRERGAHWCGATSRSASADGIAHPSAAL